MTEEWLWISHIVLLGFSSVLGYAGLKLFILCVFFSVTRLFRLKFSFSHVLKGRNNRYILLQLHFITEFLNPPILEKKVFLCSTLCLHLWSPTVCKTPTQALLVLLESLLRSQVILY